MSVEPDDDHGSASSRFRAFLPLVACLALLFAALGWFFHASQARQTTIRFTVSIEDSPAFLYSARLNGNPYQAGGRCGLGSKSVTIEAPDAEPFQTNIFTWYSGADLGNVNLSRSRGTLTVEVAPIRNKVFIRGEHFQKEISDCRNESFSVPVGEYEVASQFKRFEITKRARVLRNSSESVKIHPPVTSALLTAEPADAQFRFECESGSPIALTGKTPATFDALPTGKYHLTIWRGNFEKTAAVDLTANPTNRIHVDFDYAKVSFKTEPPGAEIRQGDEVLGQTPANLAFIPGSYRLSLHREGYFPQESEFEVKGNEEREIAVTLVNVAFVESFNRAKSILNSFNPDYSHALLEIEKALQIQPTDPNAIQLRDDIQFAQTMAHAHQLARANDVDGALKIVQAALDKRPGDENALALKKELDRRNGDALAKAAEERRERPGKAFAEFTRGIKHSELFDTQKITVKGSRSKVEGALNRAFLKDKIVWTRQDRRLSNDIYLLDADMRSLISKQRAVFIVGQITDDTCEVYFKLLQYTLSDNVQIINAKMTEDSWKPVHPDFSSWTPEVVNQQRARDVNAMKQRIEHELRTP